MKDVDAMTKAELHAELEEAVGLDILDERYSRTTEAAILGGMVQRVRMRQGRRATERPVCVLLPPETCYACHERIKPARGRKKEDAAEGLVLYGEFVLAHKARCAGQVRDLACKDVS